MVGLATSLRLPLALAGGAGAPQQGGGVQPPANFAFIRAVPGTQMRNPPDIYVISRTIGQGVSA